MALILTVDTSTNVCSVALHKAGKLLSSLETHIENSHAQHLAGMMQEACQLARVSLQEVEAFAMAKGPGSYTGLRIAASTLKGFCFGTDKPLIAISTLEAMAHGFLPYVLPETLICPMIDARRQEVYCAVYDAEGNVVVEEQAVILEPTSFQNLTEQHPVVFTGNGAAKFRELAPSLKAVFSPAYYLTAATMGELAFAHYQKSQFADVAYFEPSYLKEFYTTAKLIESSIS